MVRLAGAIGVAWLAVRGATISGSWVRIVTRRCNRRGASGFIGDLVRAGSRTMVRRSRQWCDDLSTLSISLFTRGLEMARRSRWSVTGFDEGGFERSERCDRLASMRSSCSFSLSLLFSKAGNHLKWKWKRKSFSVVLALIFDQLEMLFSLTKFEVITKHPIFRKIISRISLKSKQT